MVKVVTRETVYGKGRGVRILIKLKIQMKKDSDTDKENPREPNGHGDPKRARELRNKSK